MNHSHILISQKVYIQNFTGLLMSDSDIFLILHRFKPLAACYISY